MHGRRKSPCCCCIRSPAALSSIAFDLIGRRVVADGNGTARVWQLSDDTEFEGGGCWQLSIGLSRNRDTAVTSNYCNDRRDVDTVTAWRCRRPSVRQRVAGRGASEGLSPRCTFQVCKMQRSHLTRDSW
jgi:hypothetical protein